MKVGFRFIRRYGLVSRSMDSLLNLCGRRDREARKATFRALILDARFRGHDIDLAYCALTFT